MVPGPTINARREEQLALPWHELLTLGLSARRLLDEALSAVREAIRDNEIGSANPASPSRFRTCTANARTKKSRARRGRTVNRSQRSQSFPFGVSDLFLERVGQLKAVEVWR